MRRLVCFVLSCMFLFSAVAFADTTEEIKFRGIEWGSTYADVLKAFEGEDVKWNNNPHEMKASSIEDFACGGEDNAFNQKCSFMTASSNGGTHISVAGYDVQQIWLFLAATFDGDVLPMDIEHSALYLAKYEMRITDTEAAYEDLTEKLSSLYGEYEDYTHKGFIWEYNRIWRGANDTIAVLQRSGYDGSIEIIYAWKGAEELLQRATDYQYAIAVAEEAAAAEAAGTDGL